MDKADKYLRKLCEKGVQKKSVTLQGEYLDRLNYELEVIEEGGLATYFLIVEDIVRFAKTNGILVGPGRGSASGSLVCYLLDITMIDPLEYDLLFERFLNPTRAKMGQFPDIDLDFQSSRREEVIDYIKDKYGADCVAQIPTFMRVGVKQALRDLARICSVPVPEVDAVSKKIPNGIPLDLAENIPEVKGFCAKYPLIKKLLPQFVGTIRQKSKHAAGVIITPTPVKNYVAFERVSGSLCTCFDKDILEETGLLKMDILGIQTLDIVQDTIEIVKRTKGLDLDLPLTFNDPNVYNFINNEILTGIFQFETQNLTEYAKNVYIDSFRLLYDTTSIARPGTAHSGDSRIYIKRRHAQKASYLTPELEPILKSTYGVLVYQEQIMQIVNQLGGLSLADAERVRKLVSKSKGIEELDKYQDRFVDGCENNGIDRGVAETIWRSIREAGAYSFNKSHAVVYSVLTYWCAWLKTYHKKEFLAAAARRKDDDSLKQIVYELRDIGIEVHTPDINKSPIYSDVMANGDVEFGLSMVAGLGPTGVEDILEKRPFSSFDDFMSRRTPKAVNIKVVKNLICAGVFDSMLNDKIKTRAQLYYSVAPDETFKEWTDREQWLKQMEVIDIPPEEPTISFYENPFKTLIDITNISSIDFSQENKDVYIEGVISSIVVKPGYGHMNINDDNSFMNVLLTEENLDRYKEILDRGDDTPVLMKVHTMKDKRRLYCDLMIPFFDYDSYDVEHKFLTGERYQQTVGLQEQFDGVDLITSANYFTSSRGNKGARVTFSNGFSYMFFGKLSSPLITGDIVQYKVTKDPFIEIKRTW